MHWRSYVGVSLVYVLGLIAIVGMTALLYLANAPLILGAWKSNQLPELLQYFAPYFIPVAIFLAFFQLVMVSALYITARKEDVSAEKAYKLAFEAFPGAFIVKMLVVMSTVGILIPPILLAYIVQDSSSAFFGLFFIAAALGAIIMSVLVMFSLVAYFEDGERNVHAIGKSITLTQGRFFAVLGRVIVFAIVVTLVSLIIERIAPFLYPLFIVFVAVPYQVLFMIELYRSLKEAAQKPVTLPLVQEAPVKPKKTPRTPAA
jgi:hypothetical protein